MPIWFYNLGALSRIFQYFGLYIYLLTACFIDIYNKLHVLIISIIVVLFTVPNKHLSFGFKLFLFVLFLCQSAMR